MSVIQRTPLSEPKQWLLEAPWKLPEAPWKLPGPGKLPGSAWEAPWVLNSDYENCIFLRQLPEHVNFTMCFRR